MSKCECGSSAVGSPMHSDYCPLHPSNEAKRSLFDFDEKPDSQLSLIGLSAWLPVGVPPLGSTTAIPNSNYKLLKTIADCNVGSVVKVIDPYFFNTYPLLYYVVVAVDRQAEFVTIGDMTTLQPLGCFHIKSLEVI